jgi:hypothetical protein
LKKNTKKELIISKVTTKTKLPEIQKIAIELNIDIISGKYINGKDKFKSKTELIDDIRKINDSR